MTEKLKLRTIYSNCGYIMTTADFVESCRENLLIDSDGYGNLATESLVSEIEVRPSMVRNGRFDPKGFTHVLWYNR
jgi:hypothetical protein